MPNRSSANRNLGTVPLKTRRLSRAATPQPPKIKGSCHWNPSRCCIGPESSANPSFRCPSDPGPCPNSHQCRVENLQEQKAVSYPRAFQTSRLILSPVSWSHSHASIERGRLKTIFPSFLPFFLLSSGLAHSRCSCRDSPVTCCKRPDRIIYEKRSKDKSVLARHHDASYFMTIDNKSKNKSSMCHRRTICVCARVEKDKPRRLTD